MRTRSVALAVCALAACGDGRTTRALFAVSGGDTADDFYALPFPNDLRRHADGTLDLSRFPANSLVVDQLRTGAEQLDGFGLNASIYARFDGGVDPESLPTPAGSMQPDASVYLVNIDAASPFRGTRTPIIVRFREEPTQTIGPFSLSARPYPGFGLDEGTTYALVVTTRVHGANGDAVAPSTWFEYLAGHALEVYQPLFDWLAEPGGDDRADVASAAVFTTQHATAIMPALRKGVYATAAPVATDVTAGLPNAIYTMYVGKYQAPNFQEGDLPYRTAPAGRISVGADGAAIVQRTETLRFALTVPSGPVPPGGFPIAIYSHGTGGDFTSFVDDGTASSLNSEGIAVISMDQVLHGPRNPGGNPELDFFNFGNPYAARDNALQGAADAWSQLRLATGLSIDDGTRTITFDPTKVFFFGHSQGGLTGPGFVAFEPSLSGAVLSGTAGLLYVNLLHKTKPLDIPALVTTFLRDEPVDEDNPSLALVQMWAERSDPVNYAPLMTRRPVGTPRNIFQTEGFTDSYSPNLGIEAFATALGGDIAMLPATKDVPGLLELRGREIKPAPIEGNLDGATAVLAQYQQKAGSDGHFVVFDIAAARKQSAEFLGTLARTGKATVVAP